MQNLKGILPDKAVQALDELAATLSTLKTSFTQFSGKPFVTKPQADSSYGPAAQQKALQVSGSNPLNVAGLIGILSQPQFAKAPVAGSAPTSGPAAQPGTLVTINNVINYVVSPGVAQPLSAVAITLAGAHSARPSPAGIADGTLYFETDRRLLYEDIGGVWKIAAGIMIDLAANRPAAGTLGSGDTGFIFLASDTMLFSYFDGAAWQAVPVNTVAAGTYGDSTHVAQPVVDANGRVTAINSIAITTTATPPAGADTQVQFNNAGVFGASPDLIWNGTVLSVTAINTTSTIASGANIVAGLVFNSQADVNGGNALQTSTGTMHITGTGVGAFQSVGISAGQAYSVGASVGFTGTLAAAIAAGKSVVGGIIVN